MSLLINGMDIPKDCSWCPCECEVVAGRYVCAAIAAIKDIVEIEDTSKKLSCCPLSEIPTPHGRLIDADRLIAVLKSTTAISQSDYNLFNHIVGLIEHQPTVIEKEKE